MESVDLTKYKPQSKEERQDIHTIVEMIKEGDVSTWDQLEIMGSLNGIEINDMIFINLLKYLNIRKVYDFMYRSINECDDCKRFFDCFETIEKIIEKDGEYIFTQGTGLGIDIPSSFDCIEFLSQFEIKNPVCFLKYFLKTDPNAQIGKEVSGYARLLNLVLKRTRLRASKNSDFKRFIPRLEEVKRNCSINETYLN